MQRSSTESSARIADLQFLDGVECLNGVVITSFLSMAEWRPGSGEKL